MLENVFVLLVSNLVEIIHVELANKRREISMSKVDRKDLLLETINIKDSEVGSLLIPDDDIRVEIVLNGIEVTSRISKVLEMKMEGPVIF